MQRNKIGDVLAGAFAIVAIVIAAAIVRRELVTPAHSEPAGRRLSPNDVADVATGGHLVGPANARLKIIEFSDFQCPACRRLQLTLRELRARHPETVAVIYRHYPLAGHSVAVPAAIASECAAEQNRFEPYADLLFAHQDSLAQQSWEVLAVAAGVPDTARFRTCRADQKVRARIDKDVAMGQRLGIIGTPTLVLGDRMTVGTVPVESLEALLRAPPQ